MLSRYSILCFDFSLGVLGLFILTRLIRIRSRRRAPLPPGPKGLPLIGNVFDMPSEKEWLTFSQWGDVWGDVCSVTVLGQNIVILNSARATVEMLDKKSSIYSDRPVLQMGGELVGWKNTLALLPYGDRFRRYRRLFHNLIGSHKTMKQYFPAEEYETRRFLRRVLTKPEELAAHIRRTAGAVVLRISYGYEVKESNDPFVELADRATEQFSLATAPGGFLVDIIPALRHVPQWFPGAEFQRKARSWALTLADMVELPHSYVKQQLAAGTAPISFSSTLLESKQLTSEEEFDLKWSAASLYSGEDIRTLPSPHPIVLAILCDVGVYCYKLKGQVIAYSPLLNTSLLLIGAADTTVSAIYAFFLAMTLHPQAARKAQAEIDAVVGQDRLPGFADRDYLPYVNALVKEIFRWNTVVPLAIPHRAMQDDIHDGYLIPKGSLVIPNIWKLTHDPKVYREPFVFNPDRFLGTEGKPAELDPREFAFGFGRRTCPGMHLADASVWISCAMSLAVFDVSKRVENGVVIEPVHDNTTGTISHPKPFQCTIKPRSEKAVSLIQTEEFRL